MTYVHPLLGVTPANHRWSVSQVYLFVTGYRGVCQYPLATLCLGNYYRTLLLRRS